MWCNHLTFALFMLLWNVVELLVFISHWTRWAFATFISGIYFFLLCTVTHFVYFVCNIPHISHGNHYYSLSSLLHLIHWRLVGYMKLLHNVTTIVNMLYADKTYVIKIHCSHTSHSSLRQVHVQLWIGLLWGWCTSFINCISSFDLMLWSLQMPVRMAQTNQTIIYNSWKEAEIEPLIFERCTFVHLCSCYSM